MTLVTNDGRVKVRLIRKTMKVRVTSPYGDGLGGNPWIEFDLRDLFEDANVTTAEAERFVSAISRVQSNEIYIRGEFRSAFMGQRRRRFIQVHGRRCYHCGLKGDDRNGPDGRAWHIDHLRPISRGGGNEESNLALSCARCNVRKSGRTS
jgi:hypothetical protein